jgi:hypothetical protein
MPTPTDLVTDLPADFEVFGQAVDTSMADLKGGTTGQILSKASNTNMDFTWITNDVGDITAVNVTAPITGGGTSGAVTIGVDAASTAAAGVVQLSDSTSTTSSVLASTPTATKSAFDLATTANTTANAAIAKTVVTTAGDIIYRNATVPVRLGIGTAGQVLQVNSGATAPEWAAAPATSGPTFSAHRSASQTLVAYTDTKMAMNTELWDSDSCYNNTTYRFTPNKAGYYNVDVLQMWNASPTRVLYYIFKNGSSYIVVNDATVSGSDGGGGGSALVPMNGTTDYLEFYVLSTGTPLTATGSANSRFNAIWLRSL